MSGKKETQKKELGEKATIKASEMNPRFKYEIKKIPGAEKIMMCFQCGTCTADCPIARFSDSYRPRKLMRMTQLGLKNRVLSSDVIWLCAACFTCVDHCPQDVEIAGIIRALRNLAVDEGFIPVVFRELGSSVLKTGYAYRIPESRHRKREEQGLPPLPKANLESIAKLSDATGFTKLLEEKKEA